MSIRITRSARKHRVGAADIREAMAAAGVPEILEGGKLVYIGTDGRGVELEVVAIPADKHSVIHAMTTHYRKDGPQRPARRLTPATT